MNKNNRKLIFLPLLFLIFLGAFLITKPALAWDPVADASAIFGWLIMQVVSILGKILTWVIALLIKIAQYNGFITAPAVSKGWIIIRDLCNMFFIAALLIIAFGTVLKVEKYSYKRTLGGLLVAAVLINFSKFICGFFIDIAQILMLTFVKAFKDAAAGNFLQMLGMDKWLNFSGAQSGGYSAFTGSIFALILIIISLIVISIMMIILAFRIVIIWLLVVLSPLVFVLNIFPGKGQSYSNMWWEKFTNQLIVGPVMAFFIWLSFSVASESSIIPQTPVDTNEAGASTVDLTNNSISEAANPSNFAKFVVSIAMLVGSLLIAQNLGVAGGKLAGKAVGKMQAYATGKTGFTKKIRDRVENKAKGIGKGVLGATNRFRGRLVGSSAKLIGMGLSKVDDKLLKGGVKRVATKGVIQPTKNAIAGVKNVLADSQKRLAGGTGNIFDHAINNIQQGWEAHGSTERSFGQVEQIKRVEETKKRLSTKSEEQLKVINNTGSTTEKAASGILLSEKGSLKKGGSESAQIIENTEKAMKWNKPLRDQFDKSIKKTSSIDSITETQYNDFKDESDTNNFWNDVNEGLVDLSKALKEMTKNQVNDLVKHTGGIGNETAAGEKILKTLDYKQIEDLSSELGRTKGGKEKRNELFNNDEFSRKPDETRKAYFGDDTEDVMELKYFKMTGLLENIHTGTGKEERLSNFIDSNKKSIKDSTASGSSKSTLSALESLINKYNTAGKIDTSEAKRARNMYIELSKGKDIDKIYQGITPGSPEEVKINNDLKINIRHNKIKMEHLGKIPEKDLATPGFENIRKTVAEAMDFKKFAKLVDENKGVAELIAGEFKILAAATLQNSKYNVMLGKMKKSEFGEIFV